MKFLFFLAFFLHFFWLSFSPSRGLSFSPEEFCVGVGGETKILIESLSFKSSLLLLLLERKEREKREGTFRSHCVYHRVVVESFSSFSSKSFKSKSERKERERAHLDLSLFAAA